MMPRWSLIAASIAVMFSLALADGDNREKPPPGPHCLRHCNDMFFDDMYEILGDGVMAELKTLSLDKILHVFANTTNFKLFCKIYQTHKVCMDSCPASFFREIFRQGMRIINFHCVDRYKDIVKYFPCFGKIDSDENCLNSCSTNRAALYQLSSQFKNLALAGDSHNAERLLNQSCEFMSCSMDCDIPRIRERCGEPLVTLLHELIINSFDIIHDIALGTGAIEIWPTRCTMLQKYTVPPPPKEKDPKNRKEVKEHHQMIEHGVVEDDFQAAPDSNKTPKDSAKASDSHVPAISLGLVTSCAIVLLVNKG